MAAPQVTNLPTAPSRNDSPSVFAQRADAFVAALTNWNTSINDATDWVNLKFVEIEDVKTSALTEIAAEVSKAQSSENNAEQYASESYNSSQVAQSAANFKGVWTNLSGAISVPSTVLHNDVYWQLLQDLANVSAEEPGVSNSWLKIEVIQEISRPSAISPLSGDTGLSPTPTLSASGYESLYSNDLRNVRRFQVDISSGDFSTPVYEFTGDVDIHTLGTSLSLTTGYKWRCRDESQAGRVSLWMTTQLFSTGDVTVDQPTVTVEGSPSDVPEQPLISTSAFSVTGGVDTHLNTDWQILDDQLTVVWESLADASNLTSVTPPAGILQVASTYTFRARHRGNTYGASDWGSVIADTAASFFDFGPDGMETLQTTLSEWNSTTTYAAGDRVIIRNSPTEIVEYESFTNSNVGNNPATDTTNWQQIIVDSLNTTGYFGEVANADLVYYNYRGDWIATRTYSINDSVAVSGVKYLSLTNSNTGNDPTTDATNWQLDERENLPTYEWLIDHLGIKSNSGVADKENLINANDNWLKFIKNGKILYVAKKPMLRTVSWEDMAVRDAIYGNRTVRIGTRLYRVRLLTGAEADPSAWTTTSTATDNYGAGSEWNDLIYRIHVNVPTDGTDTYHGGPQVGSNWASFTDADIVVAAGDGRATWCQETVSYDTARRVIRGNTSLPYFGTNTSSGSNSVYGFRPCLELLSDSDLSSLYEAEDTGPGPGRSALQYDFHTDTGYYGEVNSTDLIDGDTLASNIGLTAGTSVNSTAGWLKFYWHGQIVYIAKKPLRHTVSWDSIHAVSCVYGVDGNSTGFNEATVTVGTDVLTVRLMKNAQTEWFINGGSNYPSNQGYGIGSEWNDLIYRIHTDVPDFTTTTYQGGEQIGSNWASFTDADIVVAAGDGRYSWGQETLGDYTTQRVLRGAASLSYFSPSPSSNSGSTFGFRPLLVLQ